MNDPVFTDLVMRETGLPIARELSEMLLTQRDIANSLATLTAWSKSYCSTSDAPDRVAIEDSLFRDGITQFVGCFDSKNAFPLVVEDVYPSVEGIGPYFRWLRDLRNSYTAHRHGAARQCAVGVFLHPVSGEPIGTGEQFASYRGPSVEGHSDLLSIIGMASRYVASKVEALQKQFRAEAFAIPVETLLRAPFAGIQAQAPTDMRKSRGDVQAAMQREPTNNVDDLCPLAEEHLPRSRSP